VRLSDYIAEFVAKQGVEYVFGVTGGGAMYLNDAFGNHEKFRFVPMHHEQSASMAAEGYARIAEKIGVLQVTTGPGGTNAITGVCGAWVDSIPLLVVSGQIMIKDMIGGANLRQVGVQEVDIISMVRPITKYAVVVSEPKRIRYHLEKALYLATTGKPGPVWLDVPLDIQNAQIDPDTLEGFEPPVPYRTRPKSYLDGQVAKCLELIRGARRPILMPGYGVRLAGAVDAFRKLADRLGFPIVTTWNASDIVASDHPLFVGRAGLFGDRASNFAVQNADLILVLGSRMSIPQVGYNAALYARHAKLVMVDIDENELFKQSLRVDLPIPADAGDFISALDGALDGHSSAPFASWRERCQDWRRRYPVVQQEYRALPEKVNSYYFIERLCAALPEDVVVVTDMGTSFTCTMQTFKIKHGQRLFTSSGLAAMGFGLPGSIGACFGHGKRKTISINGDGGFMFNIQELQTIAEQKLPISIFVLSNYGYLTMQLMQQNHFKRFVGSGPSSQISCPDFTRVADAFGIPAVDVGSNAELDAGIARAVEANGPILVNIQMPEMQPLVPRVQTQKTPDGKLLPPAIENMYPFLDREEFLANMIVPPVDV
jgi:acetolactate synthase-1/2/3 large subunit